ncbi:type I-E CRISPR-associated endoribonuclease Cas2e [Acidithrix sp. C25]|uniref:type I-E CRISPR-associated endoribonuclease Cas2e n=1 Tax=Acidithrix sp. C25 TaxID=1671482 RepID=UPI00191BBB0F|nr:type I-E CRISPR-associated endoribonuclease Cas2e [Acidithrix sp. C25]
MFIVLVVESVPDHLRGYLERFLCEVRTGTYVGTLSSRVIDQMWEATITHAGPGDVVMVNPENTECGFRVRAREHPRWQLVDHDGWLLPQVSSYHSD